MLSKMEINKLAIKENMALLACPICGGELTFQEPNSFVCPERHGFDIAKPGYLNLLKQAHKTKYDQALFESRKKVIASGFFGKLIKRVTEMIADTNKENIVIYDAGCGEGSHLARVVSELQATGREVHAAGLDIAKEGVKQAARDYPGIVWTVADLANCPNQAESADVLLNILSPSNYEEFKRLLKTDGFLLKVVPEANYLRELREFIYVDEKSSYSNESVTSRLAEKLTVEHVERVTYKAPIAKELFADFLEMTPLGWHIAADKKSELLANPPEDLTVDLQIMIAKKTNLL
ncbi:methyltransferase domain-containing protein [Listeria sp. FSL L7-0233]|uniref:putative RNA methyltransferase n=1 Tax=Listeria cossartiae TaxID=2838249 RepID=UPI00162806C3|nr:methyltransferase domain-containing protein [Listeria cossartiae]MBC1546775.1 methyltransferase domain-containing protein [Listeria cossartiae subsp. cossartiae]MBC1569264.1 methyltransferase domain-containing protein [Listeria cossartiae subsp. cossartiae]MBC1571897.1 methyltransferase domain-containing protein [Listeria cossartiae subsp. cossartiae]MBC2183249.1 methyltransferase domain-containing protein [Listeria cossartiae subsp. cossartiae]